MSARILGISSMATRALLAELSREYELRSGFTVVFESVGGVDARRRVQAGERFDLVVLASAAIDQLLLGDHLLADSKVDIARSGVAVAVRAGAARPDLTSEGSLRQAVLAARSVGYSTGPSGVQLAALFERWGITHRVRDRLVVPPPGEPVGALVARGDVELGFQQLSELTHVEGIDVVGELPGPIQIVTTFSGAVGARASQPHAVRALLAFMSSDEAAGARRREGMQSP
jgi:molybdate transport system substrate-binding protein